MQDVLQEQLAQTVFKALKEQGGHIYVCGDVTMAGDVLKAVQLIVRQQGQLSAEEAGAFLSKLRVSGVRSVPPPPVRATAATPARGTAPAACPPCAQGGSAEGHSKGVCLQGGHLAPVTGDSAFGHPWQGLLAIHQKMDLSGGFVGPCCKSPCLRQMMQLELK